MIRSDRGGIIYLDAQKPRVGVKHPKAATEGGEPGHGTMQSTEPSCTSNDGARWMVHDGLMDEKASILKRVY